MPARDVIYKVRLSNGRVCIGPPQRLSALLATYNHGGNVRVTKVETVVVTHWEDVTEGFVGHAAA